MGGTLFSLTPPAVGGLMGLRERPRPFGDTAPGPRLAAEPARAGLRTFPEEPHIATFLAYAPGEADEVNERRRRHVEDRRRAVGLWSRAEVPGWVESPS